MTQHNKREASLLIHALALPIILANALLSPFWGWDACEWLFEVSGYSEDEYTMVPAAIGIGAVLSLIAGVAMFGGWLWSLVNSLGGEAK